MPNVNFYSDETYNLHAIKCLTSAGPKWNFVCELYGKSFICENLYASKKGAIKAGRKWIKKYIHDEIP